MADFNAGDVVAKLRIDASDWQRGLQQAQQQLAQFSQQAHGAARPAAQAQAQAARAALQAQVQAGREALQAAQHAAQAQTQAVRQAGQAQTQAARSALQAQTQAGREALQAAQQRFQAETQAARQAFQAQQHAAQQAAQAQAQVARQTSSAWQTMLQIAGGIGIATSLSAIVSGLTSVATAAVQAAARMETLRAQFTALQGEGRAAVTLQTLFATAQRLGVEFGTLATAFRGFDAATQGTAIEGAKAQRVFEQITTGMRGMGASSEQVGRALLALQQMVSKGTVSQEELRQQLGEALPGAMGIAARAIGVTTQELNKMIEKGQESTGFVVAFANQVEREFGGKAATATNTLASAWQRFANELEQFKGSLAGGELVGQLRDLANWAAKFLETVRQGRELRDEALGGPARSMPYEMEGMRDLQARQKEIEDLRRTVERGQQGYVLPGMPFIPGMPTPQQMEEARTKLLELQKTQDEAIKRMRESWAAEADQPLIIPGARQADAIRKIQDDLQKQLRDLDLTADFVTPLELAEAHLKAIEDAFKRMREIVPQIGEGLRHTLIPTGKPSPYDAMFEAAAAKYRQDPNVLRALGEQESGLRPDVVSRKGAVGIMQIMPGTAAQYGQAGANLKDAATNIELGAKIFADLMKRFNNDVTKALTAYNAGPGRGGIPLPTGENATFAADVLRRIPRQPGDILAQTEAQRRAAELRVEAEKPDTERLARTREIGREDIARIMEREREAEEAARERRRQVFATGEEYLRAVDQEIATQNQQMETLKRLAETYGEVKAARDEDTASALEAALANTVHAEKAKELAQAIREVAAIEKQLPDLRREAAASARAGERAIQAVKDEAEALETLRENLEQVQLARQGPGGFPFGESREELRLRQRTQEKIVTPAGQEEAAALAAAYRQQLQLNYAAELFIDLAQGVGSAWSSALQSIADGTHSVGEAFKEMGRSILQTMAQIAAQEATRAFIRLGLSLLTGAATGSLAPAVAPTGGGGGGAYGTGIGAILGGGGPQPGGGAPFSFGAMLGGGSGTGAMFEFQHGGIVNRPTRALVGENPATRPEYIMTRQHMEGLMSSVFKGGPGASGQAGGVAIFNFPSKNAAEQEIAQQRALGREIVLNEVLGDLSRGESSTINRMIRTLSR